MSSLPDQPPVLTHFGLCVSEMDRAVAFYCNVLGFEFLFDYRIGDEVATIAEMEDVDLRGAMLAHGAIRIELMEYVRPGWIGPNERRPLNQLGLTHMCFGVEDIEAAAERVQRWGGRYHPHTRARLSIGGVDYENVYCTDPDGVRIELMHAAQPPQWVQA